MIQSDTNKFSLTYKGEKEHYDLSNGLYSQSTTLLRKMLEDLFEAYYLQVVKIHPQAEIYFYGNCYLMPILPPFNFVSAIIHRFLTAIRYHNTQTEYTEDDFHEAVKDSFMELEESITNYKPI